MLAADDPATLVLDVDVVVGMIAGWREDFWGTLPAARRLGAAMARAHLSAGHDVVLPQLVTADEEIAPYREAAAGSGAGFAEVVLLGDLPTSAARFAARAAGSTDPVGTRVAEIQRAVRAALAAA